MKKMKSFTSVLIIICLPLVLFFAYGRNEAATPLEGVLPSISNYCNNRFDFCVIYPAAILPVQELSVNDDGVNLKSTDEQTLVSVNGSYNIPYWSPRELFEFSVKSITEENGGEADIKSTTFGENFYECFFTYEGCDYFNHSFFVKDYYISLLIKVPADQPLLMQQLRDEVSVTYGNHG